MSKSIKAYHFCSKDFFCKLKEDLQIDADYRGAGEAIEFAYEFVFKNKRINNGNGMFFLWENPENRGYSIKYSSENEADFILLELEIPRNLCVYTNYEAWCSFVMDLDEANGDYELADKICKEDFGIADGIEGSYNNIFDIETNATIQILVPYIKYDWIKDIKFTKNKIV